MSKKSRETILSNLSRVLDPPAPTRRRGANLDGLLNEYAPPEQEKPGPQSPAPAVGASTLPSTSGPAVVAAPSEIITPAEFATPAESTAPAPVAAPVEFVSPANEPSGGRQIAAPEESAGPEVEGNVEAPTAGAGDCGPGFS